MIQKQLGWHMDSVFASKRAVVILMSVFIVVITIISTRLSVPQVD